MHHDQVLTENITDDEGNVDITVSEFSHDDTIRPQDEKVVT